MQAEVHIVESRFSLSEEGVWDRHTDPKVVNTSFNTSFNHYPCLSISFGFLIYSPKWWNACLEIIQVAESLHDPAPIPPKG